jgi:hypothetical protein
MSEAVDLLGLYRALSTLVIKSLDLSDILRASLVFGVGALDSYIHSKLVDRLVGQIRAGIPPLTNKALNLNVRLEVFLATLRSGTLEEQVRDAVGESLSWQTFQRSDRISDALKLLKPGSFWEFSAKKLGLTIDELTLRLDKIVARRNSIAHEGDREEVSHSVWKRRPIDDVEVEKSHQLIGQVVDCVEEYLA